jgi:hypothetical protein
MAVRHSGVAEHDPRNAGPIALFRPVEPAREELKARLSEAAPRLAGTPSGARMARLLSEIDTHRFAPPPPLSRDPQEVEPRRFAYAAHPDLVAALREADAALPARCLWLVWGRAALVHPRTGVIFAVAVGSIGVAARLPPEARTGLAQARPAGAESFDLSAAGPEWRFPRLAQVAGWSRAAYDYASEAEA